MKLRNRIHGPRLGTKLALLGLALLVIPWFSYQQLAQMEQLLIRIQSQALLLNARGVSTLLNGREDLFNELPVSLEQFEPLFAHPLQNPIRLDGAADDWDESLLEETRTFAPQHADGDDGFSLLLGERADQLYALLHINDADVVTRNAQYLRLDNADHIRLNFIRQDGDEGRISLVLGENGTVTGFAMDEGWRFAETGAADNRIQGNFSAQDGEIVAEFRFPLDLLGSKRYFGVTWVDVDDPESRAIVGTTQSLPTADKEAFNLVVLRSPEVRNIIQGLGYSSARILVVDNARRIRAETGALRKADAAPRERTFAGEITRLFLESREWIRTTILEPGATDGTLSRDVAAAQAIEASLRGEPGTYRSRINSDQEIILAAYPIVAADEVLGSILVEQDIDDILSFQRTALEEVILVGVVSLLIVLAALVIFAGRLAWRIRNLRREANAAIDFYGRLRASELQAEMNAGDEIGDLARSVSNMLSRLHRHNTFLENMPRTLRHEINNPLNTLSTSLQNLEQEADPSAQKKYLDSAKRGVHRIGSIVQNLADAANLEDALEAEEFELIDLNALVQNYMANCGLAHASCEFVYRGPNRPTYAMVSDIRIEQMLDKIIDNAVDFHRPSSSVRVQLDVSGDSILLTVANRGPVLSETIKNSIFDSMVSHRSSDNRLHFGLGLYVVRVIAEHHGGFVRALNLADGSGVAVVVQLPRASADDAPAILTGPGEIRAAG